MCRGMCGEFKPFSAYVQRRDGYGDGYRTRCKACEAELARERRWAAAERRGARPRPKDPEGFKTCSRCKHLKPIDEFGYCRGKKDGRQSACRPCVAERSRERYQNNPDVRAKHKIHRDRWREANPTYHAEYYQDNREKHIAYVTEYQKRNPVDREVKRARDRAWYARTTDERRAVKAAWAAKNEELVRELRRRGMSRRRARLRELPVEPYTVAELLERDGTDCVLCDRPLNLAVEYPHPMALTIEHLECISWPGSAGDVPTNVALSHWRCNDQRRDKTHPASARKRAELLAAEAAAS